MDLIRWGQKNFCVQGKWLRYGPMLLSVRGGSSCLEMTLQGKKIHKQGDLADLFPVIVESPQGPRLVDGSPRERRRWLDKLVLVKSPSIADNYRSYYRALRQRNWLLHRSTIDKNELDVWEDQMVQHGHHVRLARESVVAEINSALEGLIDLTESPLKLSIQICAPDKKEDWRRFLFDERITRKKDKRGNGPHSDHLLLQYQGREIRGCASHGQQKLAAVALRLAEAKLKADWTGMRPLLLLDDVSECLDEKRQRRMFDVLLSFQTQVMMTIPHLPIGLGELAVRTISIDGHEAQGIGTAKPCMS